LTAAFGDEAEDCGRSNQRCATAYLKPQVEYCPSYPPATLRDCWCHSCHGGKPAQRTCAAFILPRQPDPAAELDPGRRPHCGVSDSPSRRHRISL